MLYEVITVRAHRRLEAIGGDRAECGRRGHRRSGPAQQAAQGRRCPVP